MEEFGVAPKKKQEGDNPMLQNNMSIGLKTTP